MFRTTRQAGMLVGALAVLAGVCSTPARSADHPLRETHSIVAQSTKATAGTGRRPISERIAASNLPLRTPTPPDCAQNAVHDERSIEEPAAATSPEAAVVEPDAAVPPAPAAVADAAPADVDADTDTDTIAVATAEPPAAVVDTEPVTTSQPTGLVPLPPEMMAHVEPGTTAQAVPETAPTDDLLVPPLQGVVPVAAPAPTVRESLLKRIKGALGTRSKPAAPGMTDPTDSRAAAVEPVPESQLRPAPRQIPIPATAAPAMANGQPTLADARDADPSADSEAIERSIEDAPARLEFDVRESRSLVGEGEQIVMRIAVRNVGGETAERVTATLFFAEGIEPVQAIGQSAEVYPGEVRFTAVPELSPGSSVDLLVTAIGTRPGSVTYRGELECRQLAGRIAREGAVTVRAKRVAAQP